MLLLRGSQSGWEGRIDKEQKDTFIAQNSSHCDRYPTRTSLNKEKVGCENAGVRHRTRGITRARNLNAAKPLSSACLSPSCVTCP